MNAVSGSSTTWPLNDENYGAPAVLYPLGSYQILLTAGLIDEGTSSYNDGNGIYVLSSSIGSRSKSSIAFVAALALGVILVSRSR